MPQPNSPQLPQYWQTNNGNVYIFQLHDSILRIDVAARTVTYILGDRVIPKTKHTSTKAILLAHKFGIEMRRKLKQTGECPNMENWKDFS